MRRKLTKSKDPDHILRGIAYRLMLKRIYEYRSIPEMAKHLGLTYECYRVFEEKGKISLRHLLLCALKLKEVNGFRELFSKDSEVFLDELWRIQHPPKKK